MRKITITVILLIVFLSLNSYLCYCEELVSPLMKPEVRTLDLNKDGKPDVTYYSNDGKNVTKVEADTNFDGKPDIKVNVKDGKFNSAEVDTNYDGKIEKKFTTSTDFGKWLNKNHPDLNDKLNRPDWTFKALKF